MHQYAHLSTENTIHSCIHLEAYKNEVDNRAIYYRGAQTITTMDSYIHPLDFVNGLPYILLRSYTDC